MDQNRTRRARPERSRRDGWTAERQLRFLDTLAATRSVAEAAAFAGMSRRSAYRLRDRRDGLLFAALWDRIANRISITAGKGHTHVLTDGQLTRMLGIHFRRERGDFLHIGRAEAQRREG